MNEGISRRQLLAAGLAGALPIGTVQAASPGRGVALVLGGGGCRGFGHIGVLRALARHGLKPDFVVGSSAGALVGALHAAGMDADAIEREGARMSLNLLRDWIFPRLGLFGGARIRQFVVDRVGERPIESLPVRYAAVATDLRSGAMRVLDRGDLGLAVQASSSAPGLIEPVRIDGRLYVDGNLSAPVPVAAARGLGARSVIAVDVTFPPEQADLDDPFDALYQGFSILTRRLALEARRSADLALAPVLPVHHDMKPATREALVEAGEASVESALPRLRRVFSRG